MKGKFFYTRNYNTVSGKLQHINCKYHLPYTFPNSRNTTTVTVSDRHSGARRKLFSGGNRYDKKCNFQNYFQSIQFNLCKAEHLRTHDIRKDECQPVSPRCQKLRKDKRTVTTPVKKTSSKLQRILKIAERFCVTGHNFL